MSLFMDVGGADEVICCQIWEQLLQESKMAVRLTVSLGVSVSFKFSS